ncbi:acyl-CoA dehydrogenase family protein [Streptomyces nigrescens]|uniref:acyl-CoA dehydrogenase family protein n=1 Tax=Streptomyces nigrescens TaxID=1920 RepID=UPI0034720587
MSTLDSLSEDERVIVGTVRGFVDKDVRPVARELEHADTYPAALIEQMKRLGIFGLAVPELCKTDPDAIPAHRGISILLVEHGPGLTVSRDLPKLGYKGVESCELSFDDYRAPAGAVLGGVTGKGFAQMMKGLETGMAKLFASETAMQIALNAVRIHGGYGYSTEFDVERYFRDAPLMIVGEGTNEIQRKVIAGQLVERGGLDV